MQDFGERSDFKTLAFAVLKQAYFDCQYKGRNKEECKLRNEAIEWICDDSKEKGSFSYWCSAAGLDPTIIRNGFLKARLDWRLKEKLHNLFSTKFS